MTKQREIAIKMYNKSVDLLPSNANTIRANMICKKNIDFFIEYLGLERDLLGVKYWLEIKEELDKI